MSELLNVILAVTASVAIGSAVAFLVIRSCDRRGFPSPPPRCKFHSIPEFPSLDTFTPDIIENWFDAASGSEGCSNKFIRKRTRAVEFTRDEIIKPLKAEFEKLTTPEAFDTVPCTWLFDCTNIGGIDYVIEPIMYFTRLFNVHNRGCAHLIWDRGVYYSRGLEVRFTLIARPPPKTAE